MYFVFDFLEFNRFAFTDHLRSFDLIRYGNNVSKNWNFFAYQSGRVGSTETIFGHVYKNINIKIFNMLTTYLTKLNYHTKKGFAYERTFAL